MLALLLLFAAGGVLSLVMPKFEPFGAQGGEMVQLAASHVPTMQDLRDAEEEQRQVRKEIIDMTGYW